jgi:hypothetical protein
MRNKAHEAIVSGKKLMDSFSLGPDDGLGYDRMIRRTRMRVRRLCPTTGIITGKATYFLSFRDKEIAKRNYDVSTF